MRRVTRKWRPPLALVLGGTLLAVFLLPVFGIVYLRLWGNILGWGEAAWLVVWIAFVATALLGYLLWRLVLRPLHALARYAEAMQRGAPAKAPERFGTHELSTLAARVIAMGDSLGSRAEGLRAYSAHVTHELKSPLTAIRGASELLTEGVDKAQAQDLTHTIGAAAARMQRLLDDLLRHAQASESMSAGRARLSDVARAVEGIDVRVVLDGWVPLSSDDLRTVLTQLANNARAHGATEVRLTVRPDGLHVVDDGPGISPGNRDRVFDPFFTTRREEGGTGMGLSIVRSLVQARGGRIELVPSDKGAAFLISFD